MRSVRLLFLLKLISVLRSVTDRLRRSLALMKATVSRGILQSKKQSLMMILVNIKRRGLGISARILKLHYIEHGR